MIDRDGIGPRIKEARERAGLTQEQMAGLLDVGVRSMQLYETRRVPWDKLSTIAEVTRCELGWLLFGEPASNIYTEVVERLERIEQLLLERH